MNRNEIYLIHEDTYINHINEKIQMYSMVRQLAHMVKNLPSNRGSRDLSKMAAVFEKRCEEMFKEWNIPGSYLIFGDENDLEYLMNEELARPEAVGYVFCDEDCDECCPCGDHCPCCEIDEADEKESKPEKANESKNDADIGELFTMLGEVMHSIFGDNITVHVFTE